MESDNSIIKFRASGVGQLMTNSKSKSVMHYFKGDLEIKYATFEKFLLKGELEGLRTEKETVAADSLSDTAKAFVRNTWLKNTYGYSEVLYTKEIQKGNLNENISFGVIQEVLGGEFRCKNQEQFIGKYVQGKPDIILKHEDVVEDSKNCWTIRTFIEKDDEAINNLYYWQGITYMHLTGKRNYRLIYILTPTPENLVRQEIKRYWYMFLDNTKGEEEDNSPDNNPDFLDIEQQILNNHNIEAIPLKDRIKIYDFPYSEIDYARLEERCIWANEYYKTLHL